MSDGGGGVFKKVLGEIERHSDLIKVIVLYHGGEPLLCPDFFSMISQIKRINNSFFIKTVSNGMNLTEKVCEMLIKSELDAIEFSLDGESAEESDYVRVKSNTRYIVENIKKLIERKNTTTTPAIYIATTQFLRDNNCSNVPLEPIVPIWLKQLFNGNVSGYKSTYALKWPDMADKGIFDYMNFPGEDKDFCDHIMNTITVPADGTVVPCCYDLTSKFQMGSILNESLMDIWNGSKYVALRHSIHEKKYTNICANCAEVRPPTFLIPKWKHFTAV